MRTGRWTILVASIALTIAVLACSDSRAATINASGSSTLDNGTTLGPGNYGTVTYTFLSGTVVNFDVHLNSGYQFINTGFPAVFAFTTDQAINIVATTNPLGNAIGTWSGVGNGTGSAIGMDGAGNFGGGLNNSLSGGSNLLGNDITFTISGAQSLVSLLNAVNSGGHALTDFFAADICVLAVTGGGCSATGVVFDGPQISSVPVPGALPLFATGLGALGLLGWRRKKKLAA